MSKGAKGGKADSWGLKELGVCMFLVIVMIGVCTVTGIISF